MTDGLGQFVTKAYDKKGPRKMANRIPKPMKSASKGGARKAVPMKPRSKPKTKQKTEDQLWGAATPMPRNKPSKKAVAKKAEMQRAGMSKTRTTQQADRPTVAQRRMIRENRVETEMRANLKRWKRANKKGLN